MVKSGVYSDYVQSRIVQAQYYRDPANEKGYLERNRFLPGLNNENDENVRYKQNLSSLDKFVMIRFSEDVMIKPGYTAVGGEWLGYVYCGIKRSTSGSGYMMRIDSLFRYRTRRFTQKTGLGSGI
ncbi:NADH:ubiquinone oxidoreductase [Mucor velutinosus]|uniref:NADH:ubiquinone oxidoreductase n=1 Tax=Mucor velutinosus TaxID=708070 RepID=A0AAN7I1A0_9FUNG|nr:NADH:ubiquinone oxidoreductase [Mucor velutinosus]